VNDYSDPDHLRDLYDRHSSSVYRIAYRLTGSAPDAEDVVQDLFVALPMAFRGYEERGSMGGWIRTVATRLALRRIRRRRNEVPMEAAADVVARGSADGCIDVLDVQRALQLLPETLRAVLVLREIEGYSHAEIANVLGIRAGTSKVRLHRAREEMRQLLTGPK
jgi:RNA polymerase sigma-70 factor (ECF subfamily)